MNYAYLKEIGTVGQEEWKNFSSNLKVIFLEELISIKEILIE